jgi:predicted nuclease with TOPRIM domain
MEYCITINLEYVKDFIVAFISAGIPSIVAWKVYKGWRIQKKFEKLSSFSEELYKKLSELNDEIYKLYKTFNKLPVTDINKNIEDLVFINTFNNIRDKFNDFKVQLEILYDKTANEFIKNEIDLIQNILNNHYAVYSYIIDEKEKEKKEVDQLVSLNNKISEFNENFINFKKKTDKILTDYIFYEDKQHMRRPTHPI